MHAAKIHSHLGGYEYIHIHCPQILDEIYALAQGCDNPLFSVHRLASRLRQQGWAPHGEAEFIKERVALNLFPKAQRQGIHGSQLALFTMNQIDVGIEILPIKAMQSQMSSGVAYYEGELYNVVRNGRGVPAVPLVIVGIDA